MSGIVKVDDGEVTGPSKSEAKETPLVPVANPSQTDSDARFDVLGEAFQKLPAFDILGVDILGEVLQKSPAFKQFVAKREFAQQPQQLQKSRVWSFTMSDGFEDGLPRPILGKKGESKTVVCLPKCYFRADRLELTDSFGGVGTRINQVLVGGRLQKFERAAIAHEYSASMNLNGRFFPISTRALADAVNEAYYDKGLPSMDTCQPAFNIVFFITFTENCEWSATLHGKAVL